MNSRENLTEGLKIANGVILSPGKFEGEPVYALAVYDIMMEGSTDVIYDDESPIDYIDVDEDFLAEWPEAAEADVISIYVDDQGFVHTSCWDKIEWDNFCAELIANAEL